MPSAMFVPAVVKATCRNGTPPSRISHYGWFSSHKDGSMIPTKGTLAAPFLELVHMQPEIRRVDPEPEPILFWSGKGWERYRAMYGIVRKGRRGAVDRTVDVEVLTDLELARDKAKWKRIRQAYRQDNRTLLIFTNHAILSEPRLTNAMIVNTQAGSGLIPRADIEAVLTATQGSLTFTLNEVVAKGVLSYEQAYGAVLNMVASGEFSFATDRLFDGDTPVSRRR
ncbi:hypothetical protein JP75_05195 [Devosia riboflavina]|uniref:Uncharacterized protein n=1 Tax=Devosia riboflavina TaxID=46914 RepID=A0A087M637_9HYPH|nr:hypothetical protein [Devosia riboflavina]KFL32340.1 hypothetical protein JP75_05195 [Devosia riboflavina]